MSASIRNLSQSLMLFLGVLLFSEVCTMAYGKDIERSVDLLPELPAERDQAWNVSEKPLLTLKYPRQRVDSVAFSSDSQLLATECFFNLRLTNIRTGKAVAGAGGKMVRSLEFSPQGDCLVLGTSRGQMEVLGLPTLVQRRLINVNDDERGGVEAVAVSHDVTRVAGSASDGSICVWDVESKKKLLTFESQNLPVAAIKFSPEGKLLAVLYRERLCNIYDLATGKRVYQASQGGYSGSIRYSPDGKSLAILSSGTVMHLWEFASGRGPVEIHPPEELIGKPRINGVGFGPEQGRPMDAPLDDYLFGESDISPDFTLIASVLENGRVAVWERQTCKVLKILAIDHEENLFGGGIDVVTFSPDSRLLAIGNTKSIAQVWRLRGSQQPAPARQPIAVEGLPGPWGTTAIDGLRTRILLEPLMPDGSNTEDGPLPSDKTLPQSKGLWWRAILQVRNESDKPITIALSGVRCSDQLEITHEGGPRIPHERVSSDKPTQILHPYPIQPGSGANICRVLLGRNHDMSKPGTYRLQFPGSTLKPPYPSEVNHPTLPASNFIDVAADVLPQN